MPAPDLAQRLALRERPRGLPVMRQRWANLGFFHWAVDPALVVERLPGGLHVDTFEGRAWLGVVPFFMQRIRPVGVPALPWFSWFLELNVRTYVHDDRGNSGVWFFSLDCNQLLAVEIARRSFQLPYEHAVMSAKEHHGVIDYRSRRRRQSDDAVFRYPVAKNPLAAAEGSLEWFLLERYLLFSANRSGNLFSGRVHHQPYRFEPMESAAWSTEPLRLNGFPEFSTPPDSMLTAATVDVTVFPLRRLNG
jgi:uncharacterized protein YqjF (DUF2071 family)